jgi:hypothetical protein
LSFVAWNTYVTMVVWLHCLSTQSFIVTRCFFFWKKNASRCKFLHINLHKYGIIMVTGLLIWRNNLNCFKIRETQRYAVLFHTHELLSLGLLVRIVLAPCHNTPSIVRLRNPEWRVSSITSSVEQTWNSTDKSHHKKNASPFPITKNDSPAEITDALTPSSRFLLKKLIVT